MNTCTAISTYHRSMDGDTNKIISKFINANIDNLFILFDNSQNIKYENIKKAYNTNNICSYNNIEFNNYGFNKPINLNHRWGNHQNPKYFYAHFRMLMFFLKYSSFDYYWFFDDDITFDGNISAFLKQYNIISDDFIVIQAFKKENYENYPKISVINNKMLGSHGNWLSLCPGPGDKFKNSSIHIGSFFPIVRFSNKALKHLYSLHQEGYYGYSEGFVPTSLASDGLSVSSILDDNDNFFVPNTTDCHLYHKGIDFTWSWL